MIRAMGGGGWSPPFTNFYIIRLREVVDISNSGFFGVLNPFLMSVFMIRAMGREGGHPLSLTSISLDLEKCLIYQIRAFLGC